MKYAKPPLSLEQQADQLLARGMVGDPVLMTAPRLRGLLSASPDIPLADMGFPANWQQCPIWVQPKEQDHG